MFMLFDESSHAPACCRLRCEYRDKAIESIATDFFQSVCDLRHGLTKDGLIPLCYGASPNASPSGIARGWPESQGLQDGDVRHAKKGRPPRYIFRSSRCSLLQLPHKRSFGATGSPHRARRRKFGFGSFASIWSRFEYVSLPLTLRCERAPVSVGTGQPTTSRPQWCGKMHHFFSLRPARSNVAACQAVAHR